jgi:dynein heavy chain
VTNLSLFFNPMSFLTAIMQTTSMINSFDLDQMSLVVDVLKKTIDQIETSARDGCHITGLIMEGARWDPSGAIEDSRMKELYPRMPIMTVRSLPLGKIDRRDQYECPMYKTQARGPGFVVGFWLKTKAPAKKWTIAGVGLLLDVVE